MAPIPRSHVKQSTFLFKACSFKFECSRLYLLNNVYIRRKKFGLVTIHSEKMILAYLVREPESSDFLIILSSE